MSMTGNNKGAGLDSSAPKDDSGAAENFDEPKHTKSAVNIALLADNCLLTLWRKNKWYEQGKCLVLPGGGVDIHETLPDALIREVKEELGINIASWARNGRPKIPHMFETEWCDNFYVYERDLDIDTKFSIDETKFFPYPIWLPLYNELLMKNLKPVMMSGLVKYLESKGVF